MAKLIQSLANGLNLGSIYALTALGYTMVYGIIRMINFAHGDFIMVGGFTLFYSCALCCFARFVIIRALRRWFCLCLTILSKNRR